MKMRNAILATLVLALAAPMTFAQTGTTTTTTQQNPVNRSGSSVGFGLVSREVETGIPGIRVVVESYDTVSGKVLTSLDARTLNSVPFPMPAGKPVGLRVTVLPDASNLQMERDGRARMKVKVDEAGNGVFTEIAPSQGNRWVYQVAMSNMEAGTLDIGFAADQGVGRDRTVILLVIRPTPSTVWARATARLITPVVEWDDAIPFNRDTFYRWQVLMVGQSTTGQAVPVGGVTPHFTPGAVVSRMQSELNPQLPVGGQAQGGGAVTTESTTTVVVTDEKGRIVEKDAAKVPFVVSFKDGYFTCKADKAGQVSVIWSLLDGYTAGGKTNGVNIVGDRPFEAAQEALASVELEWKDEQGKVHVYYVDLPRS